MFIFNITTNIEWSIHNEWLQWMMNINIPRILNTNCFKKYQLVRLLETDETDGPTYALQLYTESKADYNRYIELYSAPIEQAATQLWGDKLVSFQTLMHIVQ